jgi:L,D-transpeptidase ErfK/SrfK
MSGPAVTTRDAAPARRARPRLRILFVAAAGVTLAKVLLGGTVAALLGFSLSPVPVGEAPGDSAATPEVLERLQEVHRLEEALAARQPHRAWIVIDRANNRLWVRMRKGVVLDAMVSTGSGAILREPGGVGRQGREWTFDTPAGRFVVRDERHNPVWTKPDWAFLEEGQQPPRSWADRRDEGSLGAWALDLGDGYMIHGTLYERLLGRSTTHGCVRVGSTDLARLVSLVGPGTEVFIF